MNLIKLLFLQFFLFFSSTSNTLFPTIQKSAQQSAYESMLERERNLESADLRRKAPKYKYFIKIFEEFYCLSKSDLLRITKLNINRSLEENEIQELSFT